MEDINIQEGVTTNKSNMTLYYTGCEQIQCKYYTYLAYKIKQYKLNIHVQSAEMHAHTCIHESQTGNWDYRSNPLLAKAANMSLARSPPVIFMDVSSEILRDSGLSGASSLSFSCLTGSSTSAELDSGTAGGRDAGDLFTRCWRGLSFGLGLGDVWLSFAVRGAAGAEVLRGGGGATLRGTGGDGRSRPGDPLTASANVGDGCDGGVPGAPMETLLFRPRRGDSVYWCSTGLPRLLCDGVPDAGWPMEVSESYGVSFLEFISVRISDTAPSSWAN